MSKNSAQRRGYVLVLTLGLLALAAISLASLARYSLNLATTTSTEAKQLQHRWGLQSARHFFTENAAYILESQVPDDVINAPPWPKPNNARIAFQLGGQTFAAIVADEDAKVNLNAMYRDSPDRMTASIRRLQRGRAAFSVRPLPSRSENQPFSSWGQVFDLASAVKGGNAVSSLVDVTSEMTCWGGRRLNLRRSSDAAIREVATLAVPSSDANKLIEARRNWSGNDVKELISGLGLRRAKQLMVSRLFSNESRNYSVWIGVSDGPKTQWYQYVDDGDWVCFAW